MEDLGCPDNATAKRFIAARMLVDRESNRVRSMGFSESEANFESSVEWNREQVAKFAALFAAPPTVEKFELAAEVTR